jgi:hypothetical protein
MVTYLIKPLKPTKLPFNFNFIRYKSHRNILLKIKARDLSGMSVILYHATRRHQRCCDNLKHHTSVKISDLVLLLCYLIRNIHIHDFLAYDLKILHRLSIC